jgi:serine/threonine protein kinase
MTKASTPNADRPVAAEPLPMGFELAPGYEVIAHLSRGRRLDVYDAWSRERSTRCVLKVLRPERMEDGVAREQLVREGRLLERLAHPHIVRGYETITEPDPIVVMETLAGETLGHLIEEKAPLAAEDVAHLGLHLGAAVAYLHRHGFLHLDVKPDNVVAEAARAKVIDLSLSRPPGQAPSGIGTWCYLAPEQALGGDLGPAADVWGIGATLFEAGSGEPAFDDPDDGSASWSSMDETSVSSTAGERPSWETGGGEDPWEGDYPQLDRPAPALATVSGQPPALCELVDACLAPTPEARPTVAVLMARLEAIAGVPERESRFRTSGPRG